jgi:hypothetical protein
MLDATRAHAGEARPVDILFTHGGGKGRLPMIVEALARVGVPVRAIADFDVLREETRYALSLNGSWRGLGRRHGSRLEAREAVDRGQEAGA